MGRILNWIRSVTQRMFGTQNFYKKAGVPQNAVTTDMVKAIEDWCNLYENRAPWLLTDHHNLGLPARIASDIATMVTVEMQMRITDGTAATEKQLDLGEVPKTRAAFLKNELEKVHDVIQQQTEYACAKGGLVFKPYPDATGGISFDFVQADDFYPCAYNSKGEITSAVFLARKKEGDAWYTRIEKHTLVGTHYTVTNECFRAQGENDDVGTPASLSEVPEWADLAPVVDIDNVDCPLFAYFRIPLGNTVDPKSPLGVSVYALALQAGLLEKADKQYQSLMWEYEGGELAIDASKDAFKTTQGRPQLPAGKERLYRMNTIDGANTDQELLKTFSPTLRDESYTNGLQTVLKQIEDCCGLSRGSLSEVEVEARTATEIKMAKQRTYATVTSIQKALEKALRQLVRACDFFATLYDLAPEGEYDLQFVWDDSVIVDAETERQHDLDEVTAGIMQKWEYRKKWYGEDDATAKSMVAEEKSDDELMGFGLPNKKPIEPSQARGETQTEQKGGENE